MIPVPAAAVPAFQVAGPGASLPWLVGCGIFGGLASMLLYRLLSPQQRLAAVAEEARAARRALARYDGDDWRTVAVLARRSIALAFRQVLLVAGPVLIAVLPTVFLAWRIGEAFHPEAERLLARGPEWLGTGWTAFWGPFGLAAIVLKVVLRIR